MKSVPISSGWVKRRCAATCASSAASLKAPRQGLRPRGDAQPFEEDALRVSRLCPAGRGPRQRLEIDMRGQVRRPRRGQRVGPGACPAPPAACRPATASRRNRRSAPRRHARRSAADLVAIARRLGADLHDIAVAGVVQPVIESRAAGGSASPRPEAPSQPDAAARATSLRRARTGGWAGRRRTRWPAERAAGRAGSAALGATQVVVRPSVSRWMRAAAPRPRRGAAEPRRETPARRASRAAMSAIRVPRPGPSSARAMARRRPWSIQACASASPRSSPNIWEISGAVVKSPAAPAGRGWRNSRARGATGRSACSRPASSARSARIRAARSTSSAVMPAPAAPAHTVSQPEARSSAATGAGPWSAVAPQCSASPSGLPGEMNCGSGWRTNSTANRAARSRQRTAP